MKQKITFEAETTEAHGACLLDATMLHLEAQDNPASAGLEHRYEAVIALDTTGSWQLAWRTNGDWFVLLEDGDELPSAVIKNWRDGARRIGADHNNVEIGALADYLDDAAGCSYQMETIVVCGNNEVLFGGGVDDATCDEVFLRHVVPVLSDVDNVRVEQSFKHWAGGPGYGRGFVYCLRGYRDTDIYRILPALEAARAEVEAMKTQGEDSSKAEDE